MVLVLLIIAGISIAMLVSGVSSSSEQLSKLNTSVLDEYISNNTEESEEASSEMGKTINEVEDSNTTNTIDNTNTVTNTTNTVSQSNNTNKSTTVKNKTQEEKEETVKDPEFQIPVEGEIIKEFAQDSLVYSTTLDEWTVHNGIDIAAEKTTVVKASADGTVKSIKNDPRYGLTVVIEHVNGYQTVYSNLLTAEFITEGETVEAGQTIATVGNTATFEIADESHLHFEILKDNEYLDPELYIK